MNKAEEIFRSYFATADDCTNFKKLHIVHSFYDDSWGERACELSVANESAQRMVYDGTPSNIRVGCHSDWYAAIAWEYPNGILHRDQGPALIYVDHKGGTLEIWYRDGKETRSHRTKVRKTKTDRYTFRGVLIE